VRRGSWAPGAEDGNKLLQLCACFHLEAEGPLLLPPLTPARNPPLLPHPQSLTGTQLENTLAYGLSGFDEGEGRFLQVGRPEGRRPGCAPPRQRRRRPEPVCACLCVMRLRPLPPRLPPPPDPLTQVAGVRIWHRGPKLLAAKLLSSNGTTSAIDPDAKYNVATLDYLANGGDGFKDLAAAPSLMALGRQIDELMFADVKAAMPKAVRGRGALGWGRGWGLGPAAR
jgi:hypothetical protein